ncbi:MULTISPECIES: efflux RND transporter periplasmic adaptor subunit [Pontibacillus]|uniref:Efflux RND transporter periplasmic adaptor subunit n=1 Tax=Pontibacillus chungwhensis TaxID=265426 RepID=A0ABY8UWX0_9BACI|nr:MULTISPECIES: efflux RND transporter periplasmic adaptor subunit [Pontibacillus]MCD5324093.1 efflux RND transporter periplasmic adaptor subunit [Pontibacillus sp. HN14]WIF97850.1 efflux RND transporter periplasmic adaptor subunit [Pontibacillus chungwhensis]
MNKKVLAGAMLTLSLVLGACSDDSTEGTQSEVEQVTPVEVAQVSKGDLVVEREVFGRAMPSKNAPILPKSTGELVEVNVSKGDTVQKGDVIGRVSASNVNDQIEVQKISVQSAQKQLEAARSQRDAAEESLRDAREQLNDAKEQEDKLMGPAKENAKQAVSQAERAVDQAEAQYDSAQISVEQAQLQVDQAQAQLDSTRGQLSNAAIVATISGEVTSVNGEVGDMVSGQQPFATIVALNPITLQVSVTADELSLFKKDQEIPAFMSSLDEDVTSKVTYISSITNDSGLYPVEATVTNADAKIKPGMMATLQLPEMTVADKILVPTSAVVEENEETYVYIIEEERAVKTAVEVVRAQSDLTAITGDVTEGDQVVTKGQLTLSDDNKIRIMKEVD